MNTNNQTESSVPEFDKTYLKERFNLPYLEDTLQINNYVDILSLIYNKLNTKKEIKTEFINYEYPAEIKPIIDLFNSNKCEIMYDNEIIHNILMNMTPIICLKNETKPLSFLAENCDNGAERVEFYFTDIKQILLNNDLYDITSKNNIYNLTPVNGKHIITINSEATMFYINSKKKQENLFKILILRFNINNNNYILFNIIDKNINDSFEDVKFEIILTLDNLYKEYINSDVFKNINKLSIFNQTYDKILNNKKITSIWHSVQIPFNLSFGFVDDNMEYQHYIDFNVFLPPSDKFIKLSNKKIDQYCKYIKN